MNKKCVELLKEVINNNYHNIRLDNMSYNDDEFYYEFKAEEQVSENDFECLIWIFSVCWLSLCGVTLFLINTLI